MIYETSASSWCKIIIITLVLQADGQSVMLRSNDPCGGGTCTVYRTGSTIQGNSDEPSYFKF